MSRHPQQFQCNAAPISAICFVFTVKLKYFPTACQWFFSPTTKRLKLHLLCYRTISSMHWFGCSHIRRCTAFIMQTPNLRGSGHLNYLHQLSQAGVISKSMLPEAHYPALVCRGTRWDIFSLIGSSSDSCGKEKHHVNLMRPVPMRYTGAKKRCLFSSM